MRVFSREKISLIFTLRGYPRPNPGTNAYEVAIEPPKIDNNNNKLDSKLVIKTGLGIRTGNLRVTRTDSTGTGSRR